MTSFASHLRMYGEISKWPGMYIKIIRLSDIDIIHVGNNNNSAVFLQKMVNSPCRCCCCFVEHKVNWCVECIAVRLL